MIVEQRDYILHTDFSVQDYLEIYEPRPRELQVQTLGQMIGYYTVEIGRLNQLVHLWGYQGLDDRAERRKKLAVEPEWQQFLRQVRPMIASMNNRILVPTEFSPVPAR